MSTQYSNGDVLLSAKEYETLMNDSMLLNCLRNAGVDNWDGWDIAIEEYQAYLGE